MDRSCAGPFRFADSRPGCHVLAAAGAMLVALAFGWTLRLPFLKVTSFERLLWIAIAMAVVLLAISAETRAATTRWWSHPIGC